MACDIIYGRNPDGSINESIIQEVKAPNQKRSFLFDDLRKLVNDDIEAVNIYHTTFTGDFKELLNPRTKYDSNNEVTIDQFVTYYNLLFDMYNGEITNGFRRKEDNNRKQIIDQNEAIKLARTYNTKNPQSKYVARSFKRTGEKGDTRVYYSVKLFPRGIYNETLKRGNPDSNIESKYFSEDTTTDSVTILSKIANSSHPLNKVAENLIKYAKKNNVDIKLVDDIDDGKAAGVYRSGSNSIEINKNGVFRGAGSEPTIIHEIVHSLTFDILQSDFKVKRDFEKLYEHAKSYLEKDESYDDKYAIKDLDEFIVGLFSDAKLIKALENVPPLNTVKGYKNLFEELYDYIVSLFGFKKDINLYNQAFAVATNVIETGAEYFDSLDRYSILSGIEPVEYALYDSQEIQFKKIKKPDTEVLDKYKGALVYAMTGTGKSQAALLSKDVIDADEIMYDMLGVKPIQFIRKWNKMSTRDKEVFNNELLSTLQDLTKRGYTVLTPRASFAKYADYIIIPETGERITNDIIKGDRTNPYYISDRDIVDEINKIKENNDLDKILTLKEKEYLSDILFDKKERENIEKVVDYKLSQLLIDYLQPFGVKFDNITRLNKQGINSSYIVDTVNKLILYNQNKEDVELIPDAAGHIIVELIGRNSGLVKSMMEKVKTDWKSVVDTSYQKSNGEIVNQTKTKFHYWDLYFDKSIRDNDYYKDANGNIDEDKVALHAVGLVISESLKNQSQIKDKSLLQLAINAIQKVLDILFKGDVDYVGKNKLPFADFSLKQLSDYVASSVLLNNNKFLNTSIPSDYKLMTWEETINNSPELKYIHGKLKNYFDLAGSAAFRKQGETYRKETELIHDIDYSVPYELRNDWENIVKEAFPNALPAHGNWLSKDGKSITSAYFIPIGDNVRFTKYETVELGDNDFKVIEIELNDPNATYIGVDFFVSMDKDRYQPTYGEGLSRWDNAFLAKLVEYSFRDKDIKDFRLFTPYYDVTSQSFERPEFVFQSTKEFNNKSNPQLKSYKKILDGLSNRFGIKYTIVNNPNANWAGRYLPDGTIEINEAFIEQYPDAPFHEFFHPFLDAIAKDNKALFDNLKQEINSLLQSKDPADAELKTLLQRVLNDRDYVNADGTLNELGYKEAITELVGAHALKAHNDAWVKEMKAINPKWTPEPGESATGPGMSEARQRRLEPLMTRLFNYIKNLISKIRGGEKVETGFKAGEARRPTSLPTIPSQLNPNMTLADLGYLMGVDTKPVRLDLSASQDMPIQYKKFDDNNWINPNTYNNSNYSEQQKKFVTKYNETNKNILDEKITVDVAKLSNKKIADLLSKKTDRLELYKKRKDARGREYVENRVTMKQDLKFLQRTQKTKEEFLAEENAPASVLSRKMGTKLHAVDESILKRLLELDLPVNTTINKEDWAEITFNNLMVNDPFYKQYIDQIRKGNTPFVYEETSKGESYPIIDENGEYLGEEVVTSINKDSTRSFDEMFKSMLRIYHEVYNIQNSIDPTKKPLILMELPLYDEKADEVGSTDFMAIFSDNTAVIYDHKFINFKYNKVTFEDYKKRPENKDKSDDVLLDEIYAIRKRQGFGEARYKPNKNRAGNEYFFEIDDTNIDGLYRWKQDSYDLQLSRYADMLLNVYGIKKVRQVRVVPNAVSYTSIYDAKEKKMKIDPEKSKLQFLMTGAGEHSLLKQIPSTAELTNDVSVNQFIKELETEKLKLRNQLSKKGWDNNPILVERFNEISDAIISLKVDNGLMKVADIIKNLITDINYRLDKSIKLEKDDEGNDVEVKEPGYLELSDINDYMKQLEMYSNFVKYTKSHIDKLKKENEVEFNKFKDTLNVVSTNMQLVKQDLVQESLNRLSDINKKYDFMSKQRFESYAQQADINGFENLFTHLSNVRHPLVNMFKQMLDRVTYNRFKAEEDILANIKKNNDELSAWAKGRGISIYKAYEMLLNKDKNLIGKWSKEFYNDVTDHKEVSDKNRDWFKKNMKRSSQQEKSFKAYKDKVETSFKNKYGDNYKDEFNKWLNKNDITYNNGNNDAWFYVNPAQSFEPIDAEKYYDERYKTILKNKPLKQFYDFYREMNVELANMVDFKITANFVPEIHKDMIDSLFQNGLSVTKMGIDTYRSIMNNFKLQENRDLINISEEDKSVPVMFTDKIATEEKSIDLAKSMMLFASYVHQYKGLKELESAALALRQLIADTAMVKVDKKTGQKQRLQGSRAFETVQKDNKKILELMDTMVSHYVYGERLSTKLEGSGISPQMAKTINKVLDLNSKKNISFNFLSAAAGHLGSMAQINKIAKQGKYFTAKQLRDARASVSRFSKEAYFANEYFRISQEDITGEIANQINANALRNKYTKGGAYLLQRRSEDVLDHTVLLAMMDNYSIDPVTNKAERIDFLKDKYKDDPEYGDKFEWPTIKKMVEFKDNIGKMINPFTGKEFGEKEYISFRRKVQEIGKKTRGNMSEEDIASYKTTLAGQIVGQFKGWVPAMLRERIKKQQYDVSMEEFEVGSWVAVFQMVKAGKARAAGELMANIIPFLGTKFGFTKDNPVFDKLYNQWKDQNPEDFAEMMNKYGLDPESEDDVLKGDEMVKKQFINEYVGKVKGTAKELQMYLLFMIIMLSIMWAAGDDEEDQNPFVKGAIALLEKSMLEVGFFLPGFDYMSTQAIMGKGEFEMMKMISKGPIPSLGLVNDTLKGVVNTVSEAIDITTGISPFEDKYFDLFNIGKDPFSNPFNPQIKRDSAPMFKYTSQYIPGVKGISDLIGIFNTTEKEDTIWDWISGPEGVAGTGKRG